MPRELRLRRKALETEWAYVGWVERFVKHNGRFDVSQLGEQGIKTLNVKQATKAERLPVVLSRRDIELLFPEFQGLRRLMFLVMYGAGLRHRECRRSWICWMRRVTYRECVGRKSRATGV